MRARLALLLVACSSEPEEAPPPVCDAVLSGVYEASGPGFGMPMTTTLAFDPERCTFALDGWSMDHGVEASGGIVEGADVQLTGDAYWRSCLGAVEAEGAELHGDCAASERPDGGAFHLVWSSD